MSLAVLARKTKEKNNRKGCSRSGILNMTGRGGGIGRFAFAGKSTHYKYNNSNPRKHCNSLNQACCNDNMVVKREYDRDKGCNYNGLSQPAPQMSYRTYLNRKSAGAYRPGSKICCDRPDCKSVNNNATIVGSSPCGYVDKINCGDESGSCISRCRSQHTVKKTTPLTNSEILEIRKQQFEREYQAFNLDKCKCSSSHTTASMIVPRGTTTPSQGTRDKCKLADKFDKRMCCHVLALKQKARLSYRRINTNQCVTTKSMQINQTASDVIQKRKANVYKQTCSNIDAKYPPNTLNNNEPIRTYCDCEQQPGWTNAQIKECKMTLAKLHYPKLMNSRPKISEGCGNGRINNSKKVPCNVDGVVQSN